MTRRGSLVYYLSAWILGCFFMSLAVWLKELWGVAPMSAGLRQAFGILFFYFYALVSGALASLIGAFLLRRVAAALKCKTPIHWAVFGAILAPILIGALGAWGRHAAVEQRRGFRLLTEGPFIVLQAGWWLAIPVGAITAFLLCRIERAFAPRTQPPAATNA